MVIEPYNEVELAALEQAEQGPSFGEEHLEGHLVQKDKEAEKKAEAEAGDDPYAIQLDRDRQLSRAVDLLKSWSIFSNLKLGSGA